MKIEIRNHLRTRTLWPREPFNRFTSHIMPKKTSEFSLDETVSTLKELFGHNLSVFSRRYNYLKTTCVDDSGGTFDEYTGLVNRRHEVAMMSTIAPDELK